VLALTEILSNPSHSADIDPDVLHCRQGAGLPLFGKSFNYPAARKNMRIDFQFDQAAFTFYKLPFKIPYPVPFRYLGDETKVGWA
jgi:hypothetical protein